MSATRVPRLAARLVRQLAVVDFGAVARHYGVPYHAVVARMLELCVRRQLKPAEVLSLGLADPRVARRVLASRMGRRGQLGLMRRVNPREWECLGQDKVVFATICQHHGWPAPKLLAVVQEPVGWSPRGPLRGRGACRECVRSELPDEFVVKPTTGLQGRDVHVVHRVGDLFEDAEGQRLTAEQLTDRMLDHPVYPAFLIQERARNHADLEELSGSRYLQTIRFDSLTDMRGEVSLFSPRLKLIGGDTWVDNYAFGRSGNPCAIPSLDDGRVGPVYAPHPQGAVLIERHPRTGRRFEGFRVPFWNEAKDLVRQMAPVFLPLRSLGWDIAITRDGPCVIEMSPTGGPGHNLPAPEGWPGEETLIARLRSLAEELDRSSRPPAGGRAPIQAK